MYTRVIRFTSNVEYGSLYEENEDRNELASWRNLGTTPIDLFMDPVNMISSAQQRYKLIGKLKEKTETTEKRKWNEIIFFSHPDVYLSQKKVKNANVIIFFSLLLACRTSPGADKLEQYMRLFMLTRPLKKITGNCFPVRLTVSKNLVHHTKNTWIQQRYFDSMKSQASQKNLKVNPVTQYVATTIFVFILFLFS